MQSAQKNDVMMHIHAAPILIVEDNEINRLFIEKTLRKNGFLNLCLVESAEEALSKIDTVRPDMVILDIVMPGMDGFECCAEIRKRKVFHDLPVLIQTVITEPELRVKAFRHGATDFISKPIYPDELCARVRVHLEKRLFMNSLQLYKERVHGELEAARQLQFSILPNVAEINLIKKHTALDVAAYFEPASEIGGDFWGIKLLSSNVAALWIADFSGHGVTSAINSFRLQAHMKEASPQASKPDEYLSLLNNKLSQLLPSGQFATMFYGIVDAQENQLQYACACAPHPIILRASGKAELIDGSGIPLAVSNQTYALQQCAFEKGDTLVLYSDALIETPDAVGRYISEDALLAFMKTLNGASAAAICDALKHHFLMHCGGAQTDDLTLVVAQRI